MLNKTRAKAICSILVGICMAAGISLKSQAQNFEGIIQYEFAETAQSGMGDIPYMIKDDNMRIQFGQGQSEGAMVFLPGQSKMLFILDNMKSYMEVDMDKWTGDSTYESKWSESEMIKTGQSKIIAGYDCEIWQVTNERNDELTLCMAEGLGTFMSPGNPMARQNAPGWAREIMADGYMPLEVIEGSADGSSTVQMKAKQIEKKSLSDSLFEVPSGYKDMSSMMKQMMNQGSN